MPFCLPQIPHRMVVGRKRAFRMTGSCLTAWVMARPCVFKITTLIMHFDAKLIVYAYVPPELHQIGQDTIKMLSSVQWPSSFSSCTTWDLFFSLSKVCTDINRTFYKSMAHGLFEQLTVIQKQDAPYSGTQPFIPSFKPDNWVDFSIKILSTNLNLGTKVISSSKIFHTCVSCLPHACYMFYPFLP
jgi:hypothetical protein